MVGNGGSDLPPVGAASASLAVAQNVVALLVHALRVGFVVLVAFLQGLPPLLRWTAGRCVPQGRDGTQLVEYLMFLSEAEGGEEVFEVFEAELSLASAVDDPEETADFLLGEFPSLVGEEILEVLSGEAVSVTTEVCENGCGVEVEGAEEGLVQLHESEWGGRYLEYSVMTWEKSLAAIHSIFC